MHCEVSTEELLVYYLLDCEATDPLRTLAERNGYKDSSDRQTSTARLVRYVTNGYETLLKYTHRYEPPGSVHRHRQGTELTDTTPAFDL